MTASDPAVPPGRVVISDTALAQLARATALDVYGVVGLRSPGHGPAVAGLLGRPPAAGVVVTRLATGGLRLDVHVVLGRGLNLAAVAESLRSRIVYRMKRLTGERIEEVVVHIDRVAELGGRRRARKAATVLLSARMARLLAARERRGRTVRGSRRSKRAS